MGLLTVDVNSLGIVMTSDSQPVDMFAGHYRINAQGTKIGSHIVRARANGFSGLAGYVGTEVIEGQPARQWFQAAVGSRSASTLNGLCESLAAELTEIWTAGSVPTHLSIFIAGYERGEPCFLFISNGDVPDANTSTVPLKFDAVDDLRGPFFAAHAKEGETLAEMVVRTQPRFRRGLLAAANIFDGFTDLVTQTMQEGHPQIQPFDTLERFAAYTKFRFEFTKRMYDPKYGVGTDAGPPVAGEIHVFSVDPQGTTRAHKKHVGQSRIVP